MQKLECPHCHKTFGYEIIDDRYPGCKDKEEIECPYCRKVAGYEMTSGIVKTFIVEIDKNEDKN